MRNSFSWYVIDQIVKGDSSQLIAQAKNVALGRFVLLEYTDTCFDYNKQQEIINNEWPSGTEEAQWKACYLADGKVSKDRIIYQKIFKDNKIVFNEIGYTNANSLSNNLPTDLVARIAQLEELVEQQQQLLNGETVIDYGGAKI